MIPSAYSEWRKKKEYLAEILFDAVMLIFSVKQNCQSETEENLETADTVFMSFSYADLRSIPKKDNINLISFLSFKRSE